MFGLTQNPHLMLGHAEHKGRWRGRDKKSCGREGAGPCSFLPMICALSTSLRRPDPRGPRQQLGPRIWTADLRSERRGDGIAHRKKDSASRQVLGPDLRLFY